MSSYRRPSEEEHEDDHEPPRGALVITLGFLLAMSILWLQVYFTLLNNGGIPAS